jgi:hypothetical protein
MVQVQLTRIFRLQDARTRKAHGRSFESVIRAEIFLDTAQLAFHQDHLLIEGRHGILLRLGGGAVQAANLGS